MTFEELTALRERSDRLAQVLEKQLRAYLDTLRPLFVPRRLFGKYMGGAAKEDVVGAEQALSELKKKYAAVCGKPFGLDPEWTDDALQGMDGRLELYPWEYEHQARGASESKTLRITSPGQWVLSFHCGYGLAELREALAPRARPRLEDVRQFVVNALVMNQLVIKSPGLTQLLGDLRFEIRTTTAPDLGALPLTTIVACVPSLRPPDALLLTATGLSGVSVFYELLRVEALDGLEDPLRQRLGAALVAGRS